jgi:hypothetical protein
VITIALFGSALTVLTVFGDQRERYRFWEHDDRITRPVELLGMILRRVFCDSLDRPRLGFHGVDYRKSSRVD